MRDEAGVFQSAGYDERNGRKTAPAARVETKGSTQS